MNNSMSKIIINRLKRMNEVHSIESYSINDINNSILIKPINDNNKYRIYVENFPFKPPIKLEVNDKFVNYAILSSDVSHIIFKYFNAQCLCCQSLFCPNNWYITNSFSDVINEYKKFMNIINSAKNIKILTDENLGGFNRIPDEIISKIMEFVSIQL